MKAEAQEYICTQFDHFFQTVEEPLVSIIPTHLTLQYPQLVQFELNFLTLSELLFPKLILLSRNVFSDNTSSLLSNKLIKDSTTVP